MPDPIAVNVPVLVASTDKVAPFTNWLVCRTCANPEETNRIENWPFRIRRLVIRISRGYCVLGVACQVAEYDTSQYPFANAMLDALNLRTFADLPDGAHSSQARENNGRYRKNLRSLALGHPLFELYRTFVSTFVADQFAGVFSFIERPVLRVQLAHSPSISGAHRDAEYTGRLDYVNAWLPMLDVPARSAMQVEMDYGSGILKPVPVAYGQVLFFDGGLLMHGSPPNTTGIPRVSMDFRFVPQKDSALRESLVGMRPPELVAQTLHNFEQSESQLLNKSIN